MVLINADIHSAKHRGLSTEGISADLSSEPSSSQSPPGDIQVLPEPHSERDVLTLSQPAPIEPPLESFHQGLLDTETGIQDIIPWDFQNGISPMLSDIYFHDGSFNADGLTYLNDQSLALPIASQVALGQQEGSRHGGNSGSPSSNAVFTPDRLPVVDTETKCYHLTVPDSLLKEL